MGAYVVTAASEEPGLAETPQWLNVLCVGVGSVWVVECRECGV